MLTLLMATAGVISGPVVSPTINQAYGDLAAYRAAGDVPGMVSLFEPLALLIDARPGPTLDGKALDGQLSTMVERLRAQKTVIATQYRVQRRTVSGDTAVDSGYARMTFRSIAPAAPGEARPQDMVRRFLVTWKKGPDGRWRIIGDAALPSTEAQWDALKPVSGLRFD